VVVDLAEKRLKDWTQTLSDILGPGNSCSFVLDDVPAESIESIVEEMERQINLELIENELGIEDDFESLVL
jgi:hypothetical protein